MTGWLIWSGLAIYAAAWVIPAYRDGDNTINGLAAFNLALLGCVPGPSANPLAKRFRSIIGIVSASTNFILAGACLPPLFGASAPELIFAVLLSCFVFNAYWLQFGRALRPGYYSWWVSFALLAMGRASIPAISAGPAVRYICALTIPTIVVLACCHVVRQQVNDYHTRVGLDKRPKGAHGN
jgi:hypothetical protein